MVEAGVWAYPVVLAAMIGVYRIGRDDGWGPFEWLRLGTLGALFGLLVAVQVKFAMLGALREPLAMASAVLSVGGMAMLMAIYFWGLARSISRRAGAPSESQA